MEKQRVSRFERMVLHEREESRLRRIPTSVKLLIGLAILVFMFVCGIVCWTPIQLLLFY